jgi:hypothetical protein
VSLPVDYAWVLGRLRRTLRDVPASWSDGSLDPVVLIAGVYEPWSFLADLGERLHRAGHPVHAIPAIGRNRGPISVGARHGLEYLAAHDLRRVRIVAHSKGGLVGKQMMAADRDARIDRLIAIATPFGGSSPARYAPTRTLRDLAPTAGELAELGRRSDLNSRITSIYTRWDPHIPGGSRLEGAHNIELPLLGHFRLLSDPALLATVEDEL